MELMKEEKTWERIDAITQQNSAYAEKLRENNHVLAVRHLGTILALEARTKESTSYFNPLRDRIYNFFMDRGLLLRPLGNVIYIVPPYCVSDSELQQIYQAIDECLEWLNS